MSRYALALIPGDGIGPEQCEASLAVLDAIREKFSIDFEIIRAEAGDECLKRTGVALPEDSIGFIRDADASLKGPVGETAFDVIIKLRQMLDLFANIRPAKAYPGIPALYENVDLVIVRENTEDLYKGIEFEVEGGVCAVKVTTRRACKRIAEFAFDVAHRRALKRRVTAVHKANVMRMSDGLFAQTCREVAASYGDLSFDELYVDAAAMNLIRSPSAFDVLVTTNVFGDILSDEAAQVVGGLGVAPSANIGEKCAIFEPVHGCAPDIAGKGIANPTAMLLSAKMMLEWLARSHSDEACLSAAKSLEGAVAETLRYGPRTPDLGGSAKTIQMGKAVAQRIGSDE